MNVYIINGPNLNALGTRCPEVYGRQTLNDTISLLRAEFPHLNIIDFQSNHEGDLIDKIYQADSDHECIGIVLNPGALAHYSYAIADSIEAVNAPVIEVHISNIYSREEYRHETVTGAKARAVITGAGRYGYNLGILYLLRLKSDEQS